MKQTIHEKRTHTHTHTHTLHKDQLQTHVQKGAVIVTEERLDTQ